MDTRTTTARMTEDAPGSPSGADAGLYGPASEAWRLNREAMLLLGAGPRALLLQIAHPAVAAGVADHSDFRADPWRRLAGTLRSYLTIVYGTTAAARAEIRRLNALHRGIAGPGYSARDPDLSLWVHATLVDSTIVGQRRAGSSRSRPRPRGRPTTRRRGRSAGRSACRRRCLPADLEAFERTSRRCSARAARSTPRPLARELAGGRSCHPPLAPLRPGRRRPPSCGASRRRVRLDPVAVGRAAAAARPRGLRAAVGPARARRCRPGSSPAGGPGGRCSRPASGRCRRRWPRTPGRRVGADPGPSATDGQ